MKLHCGEFALPTSSVAKNCENLVIRSRSSGVVVCNPFMIHCIALLFAPLLIFSSAETVCVEDGICFPLALGVRLYVNGGPFNDLDLPHISTSVKISPGQEGMNDIYEHAGAVYHGAGHPLAKRSIPVDVYDEHGRLLTNTSNVVNSQMLFLVHKFPQTYPVGVQTRGDLLEPFVWPGISVGHRREMHGVTGADGSTLFLVTLSLQPRLFVIDDFLSHEETDAIIYFARTSIHMVGEIVGLVLNFNFADFSL
jgi:hypothetical protein